MTIGAFRIIDLMMKVDPVRILVRFWLWSSANLQPGNEIVRPGYIGNRVANVALQADSFLLGIHMFAIVTSETARRVLMTDVVGMRGPVRILLWVNTGCVSIFQDSNSRFHLVAVGSVEI